MKQMLRYYIRLLLVLLISAPLFAQDTENEVTKDRTVFKEKYGLRFGIDLSKLGRTAFDSDYSGFEINADYRLTKNLYLAGELGFENKTTNTYFLDSNAKGSYFKAGIDFNLYRNWLGMQNMIFSGLRTGIGSFSQTRERYTIYDTNNQTWGEVSNDESIEFSGLTSAWVELLFGLKTELLNNLFLGFSVQLKVRIADTNLNNFETLYIPGFGRTYDSTKIGTGFSYNLSYLLPIYKKGTKKKEEVEEESIED